MLNKQEKLALTVVFCLSFITANCIRFALTEPAGDGGRLVQTAAVQAHSVAAEAIKPSEPTHDERLMLAVVESEYDIHPGAAQDVWVSVQRHTKGTQIDPVLMMAVIAQESRFNPYAQSGAGAQGLTQVMPSVHAEKIFENETLIDPDVAVRVGVQVLDEYLKREHGRLTVHLNC